MVPDDQVDWWGMNMFSNYSSPLKNVDVCVSWEGTNCPCDPPHSICLSETEKMIGVPPQCANLTMQLPAINTLSLWRHIALYNPMQVRPFLELARARGFPVLWAETTPREVSATASAGAWDLWFGPMFSLVSEFSDVVKGWCYIDWNWANFPQVRGCVHAGSCARQLCVVVPFSRALPFLGTQHPAAQTLTPRVLSHTHSHIYDLGTFLFSSVEHVEGRAHRTGGLRGPAISGHVWGQ